MPKFEKDDYERAICSYVGELEELCRRLASQIDVRDYYHLDKQDYAASLEQLCVLIWSYSEILLTSASLGNGRFMKEVSTSFIDQFPKGALIDNKRDSLLILSALRDEYLDPFLFERDYQIEDFDIARIPFLNNNSMAALERALYFRELEFIYIGASLLTLILAFHLTQEREVEDKQYLKILMDYIITGETEDEDERDCSIKKKPLFLTSEALINTLLIVYFAGQDYIDRRALRLGQRELMAGYLHEHYMAIKDMMPTKSIPFRTYSIFGRNWLDEHILVMVAFVIGKAPDGLPAWIGRVEAKSAGRPGLKTLAEKMLKVCETLKPEELEEYFPQAMQRLRQRAKESNMDLVESIGEIGNSWKDYWVKVLEFINKSSKVQIEQLSIDESKVIEFEINLAASFTHHRTVPKIFLCRYAVFPKGWKEWESRKKLRSIGIKAYIPREYFIESNDPPMDIGSANLGRSFAYDELKLCAKELFSNQVKALKIEIEERLPTVQELENGIRQIKNREKISDTEVWASHWLLICSEYTGLFRQDAGFIQRFEIETRPASDDQDQKDLIMVPQFQGAWIQESIPRVNCILIVGLDLPVGGSILVRRESLDKIETEEYPDVILNPKPEYPEIKCDFVKTLNAYMKEFKEGQKVRSEAIKIIPGGDIVGGAFLDVDFSKVKEGDENILSSQIIYTIVEKITPIDADKIVVYRQRFISNIE